MQSSSIPAKFPIPFANGATSGYIRTVPQTPTGVPGQASLQAGFPPENFQPLAAGGVPPFGQDFNGLLNQMTAWLQWGAAGGGVPYYDGTFSTAIGGYPKGAFLQSATTPGTFWISLAENNVVNPDSGYSALWLPFPANLTAPVTFYVNGSTGSDTLYDGTSATVSGSHGPWQTLQHAANVIANYSLKANVSVNVTNGTYGPIILPPVTGNGIVGFVGNTATPASCLISGTNQSAVLATGSTGTYSFNGFGVTASGAASGDGICGFAVAGGSSLALGNISFGSCVGAHISASQNGQVSNLAAGSNWTITGGCSGNSLTPGAFLYVYGGKCQNNSAGGPNITIANAVSFASSFVEAHFSGLSLLVYQSLTGAGNVTGKRYIVDTNANIATGGGGASYYPGTIAGTSSTGGQYT